MYMQVPSGHNFVFADNQQARPSMCTSVVFHDHKYGMVDKKHKLIILHKTKNVWLYRLYVQQSELLLHVNRK